MNSYDKLKCDCACGTCIKYYFLSSDLQILRVVSMDPSQLFGAWLDDNTFLGGYLEISLDRFATTVQIESFQVEFMY